MTDTSSFTDYYVVKYIIAGCACIGKTSLAECYADGKLAYGEHSPTIGVEFFPTRKVIDDKNLKIQIWDTAGQEKFATVVRSYYRMPHGAFICFSLNRLHSFRKVENIIQDIKEYNSTRRVDIILVGTFLDTPAIRVINREDAQQLADDYNILYMEVSSRTGQNVKTCFDIMNKIMCERIDNNDDAIKYINITNLNDDPSSGIISNISQRARGCCRSS